MPGADPPDPRYDWLYGEGDDQSVRPPGRRRAEPPPPSEPPPAEPSATRVLPQGGYPPEVGAPPPGYAQPGYQQPGYQQPGYQQPGYQQPGYPPPGQHPPAYPPGQRPGPPPGGPPHGPPPGGPGGPRPRGRRTRVRWGRIILLVLVAYLVFLIAIPIISWGRVDRAAFEPGGDRPADSPGTTYLVVGSDSREGLTAEQQRELGTGSTGGKRTDTIMLLHVPDVGLPALISIPRDSYLPIPDRGENKVNAAFAWGQAKLLAATIENATGMRIDEYVEIGFGGFVGMTDAVGGVELCPKKPIEDEKAHINLPAGCQTLDGKTALGYVRARYFDPKGDLGRVERQQEYMSALTKRALSPGTLVNPISYTRLGFGIGDALVVGEDTSLFDVARFALAMRAVSSGAGVALTVPISNPNLQTSAGSAVQWDAEKAEALFSALRGGSPIPPGLLPEDLEKLDPTK